MIYHTSMDDHARYALGVRGKNVLAAFGINPSTATDEHFDTTIRKVIGLSEREGYDGWLMLNVYPQRATSLGELHVEMNVPYHRANMKMIETLLRGYNVSEVCCAWGDAIYERTYLVMCLGDIIERIEARSLHYWRYGALTLSGNPRHPCRLSYECTRYQFDIHKYLTKLSVCQQM